MNTLTRLIIASVCMANASLASAACESGSVHEQLTCLQKEICPNPSSEAERIACYRMITTALSAKRVPAPANESIESSTTMSTTRVPAPANESNESPTTMPTTREPAPASESNESSATMSTARVPAPANEATESSTTMSTAKSTASIRMSDVPASVPDDGAGPIVDTSESGETNVERKSRFSLDRLFNKVDVVDDPNWAKVVFVRTQVRGTELIVLDNGQVWIENDRNPYLQFKRRDRVRISDSGQLIRKDGSRAKVSRVNCDRAKPLQGHCKSLGKYLD